MRTSRNPHGAALCGHRRTAGFARPVVLVSVLLAVVAGCGVAPASSPAAYPGLAPAHVRAEPDLRVLAPATTFAEIPAAPRDPAPQATTDGVVLRIQREVAVYDRPGGQAFAKLPSTQIGSPTWVAQIAQDDGWSQVLLPSRPNGSTGWVRTDNTDAVEKAKTQYTVDIDVSKRRMVIRDQRTELGSWKVAVGKPESPTPRGRTFILASVRDTVTRFSPVNLPLGIHSQPPQGKEPLTVALHGWPDSRVFGTQSSDGCVRVPDDALRLLVSLPLGTLVVLR